MALKNWQLQCIITKIKCLTWRTRTTKTTYFEERHQSTILIQRQQWMENAGLISRSGKATGKYSKRWNSKLDDDSIHPIDFEGDMDNLNMISNSSVNTLPNTDEIQYSDIYMTAKENQANITEINELESWKKQEVHC